MDSSNYAHKYMKYKLKYKNLQKSIVQAGGNKYKYKIWNTGNVEFLDMERRIDTVMDEEDKKQLFEFIKEKEPENYKKSIEKKYKIVEIESAYVPISKRSAVGSANPFDLSEYQCDTKDPETALVCLEKVIAHGKTEFSILSIGRIRTTLQDIERLPESTLTPAQKQRFEVCKQWAHIHRILPRKMQNEHFSRVRDTLPRRFDEFLAKRMTDDKPATSQPSAASAAASPAAPSFSAKETNIITVEYDDGTYVGTQLNGKQHGKGTFTWSNGDKYEGDFVNGIRQGKGTYTWSNGNNYEGDFVNGIRQGKGTFKTINGYVYMGDFVNGMHHGKGRLEWPNGDVYKGDFVNGMHHGKGRLKWHNGDVYEGAFVNGKTHGKGTFTWSNGDIYKGDFVNGIKQGKGKYLYPDGIVYAGNFSDSKADILVPVPTEKSKPYSITLFINAHGCEIKEMKLANKYPIIQLEYVNSTNFGCSNYSISDRDIAYASILFNTKTHKEAIEQYRVKKGRSGVSNNNRKYDHKFQFGIDVSVENPDNYNIFDGIIIIQNTLGLPNNVNLFNFTNPDIINGSLEGITKDLSIMLVGKLFTENVHHTLALSALLDIINHWFSVNFPKEILNLTIIDNSCRVYCETNRIS